MRHAFSLIELLISLAMIGALSLLATAGYAVLLGDVPREQRDVQQFVTLGHMQARLADDVDAAQSLPREAAGVKATQHCLILEQPGGLVIYRAGDGEFSRTRLGDDGRPVAEPVARWAARCGRITWQPIERDGRRVGVAMRSCVEQTVGGHLQRRFASVRVLRIGSLPGRREATR